MEPFHSLYKSYRCRKKGKPGITHLESVSGILVKRPVVIQDIYKRKFMPYTNFVVVGIVSGCDLNGSRSELHIDDDRIRNDWQAAVDERMGGKFTMQMLYVIVRNQPDMWRINKRSTL